jgi:uncharacterized membrane protein YhaH (DUF805 family)
MHWLLDPIVNHYADFSGRTSRKAYWMFTLMYLIAFSLSAMAMGVYIAQFPGTDFGAFFSLLGLLLFAMIALAIPVVAIHVRRFHDLGYSGWWYLLTFIPYIGALIVLVMMCLPSQEGSNKYGPHPYAVAEPLPPEPVPLPPPPASESSVT